MTRMRRLPDVDDFAVLVPKINTEIIQPVITEVRRSSVADANQVVDFDEPPTEELKELLLLLRDGLGGNPRRYFTESCYLAIMSKESIRRVVPLHGIFLWNALYRYADDRCTLLVDPFVAYRMAFDGRVHVFAHRFDQNRDGLPCKELRAEHIRNHLLSSLTFYQINADSDRCPW